MKRLAGAIVTIIAVVCASRMAFAQAYDPMYNASVISGRIGETTVYLYLGPSPFISKAAVDFIRSATNSIDVCMYEINLPDVLDELLEAHQRGVKVRVAIYPASIPTQHDRYMWEKFDRLISRKLLRPAQNKSGLMHNKFMVRDDHTFWTGSYNLTKNDTEMNDNNVITFTNPQLAANYRAEFEEIWNGRHGKKDATPTPYPEVMVGNVLVRNYFSPEDDIEKEITAEINKATNSIYIMAFALSDLSIFRALKERAAAGVKIYTLFDLELARQKTSLSQVLREEGISVHISANNGQMHHKVVVIDEKTVITGSANFSASAYKSNDENIIIFDCAPLAKAFMRECARCWLAKPYIYNKWQQHIP